MRRIMHTVQSILDRWFATNGYLKRLIWLGCMSVVIPVVLAGSAYYHFSMIKLTGQFQDNNMASLNLLKDRVENILTNIEHESMQLASGPLMRNALGNANYESDYFLHLDLLELFQLHKNTNNLIEEMIYFDGRTDMVLSHYYGLVPLVDYREKQDMKVALEGSQGAGWMYLPGSGEAGYISYVRQLPIMGQGPPSGVIILQMKEQALRSLLRSYSVSLEDQSLAILNSDQRIILHTDGPKAIGAAASDDAILQQIAYLEGRERSGHDVLKGKQGNELVAYVGASMGRTYVSQLPEREMIAQLNWIRVLILICVSIFVFVGLLLTWFSSRLAYNPIQQLLRYGEHLRRNGQESAPKGNEIEYIRSSLSYLNDQTEKLNRYIEGIQPDLRDRFFQKLLQFNGSWRGTPLAEECARHGISTEGQYIVLVVKVENLVKKKRFLPSEGPVIVFALKNVMDELLSQNDDLKGYVVDKNDSDSVAILHFDAEMSSVDIRQRVCRYAEDIHDALNQYLSFSATVGVGRSVQLETVAESFREAQLALQYRLLDDAENVLFYEDIVAIERNPVFMYPREMETEMMEALWNGTLSEAEDVLHRFSRRVRGSESYTIMIQGYHMLLSAIIQYMETKGPGMLERLGGNLFDQLQENQTSREMHDWFIGVLFPLCIEISQDLRTHSSRHIVQRVCEHLNLQPEGVQSLSECANLVNVSPSYLSRLFKKEMGVSFIEYLMNMKVQKAKQLLKDTDCTITEIAERVGYSERNLNRAFQRFVHMSPNQYRMSVR
ncbi:helix-turn-helix domain-containing protein [Paenibacillus sp. 1781tsa1]|uniref:helix-turn-helix domain-containing protein n=1 Tax=Paenibacillus sp. 1781tsa1 TaxID=2953810 RepID=UPI00209E9BEF|nr:helix-turn-helix domain-containing protein [Paenibacillus sp. 1781tsa1]MCP1182378.1 helix-turn-helix domain-containing protein [Paenibacillus sp. 1781tsa1]